MSEIPVLSLWQPWASLVALGVKTIETRSWSTKYRGPLAIHAAAKQPPEMNLGRWAVGRFDLGAPRRMYCMDRHEKLIDLPLGAIVATCTLVDVVPMVTAGEEGAIRTLDIDANGSLWIVEPEGDESDPEYPRQDWREVTDQRPYGDYTPGRYAWVLADIVHLNEPVPFKGGQRLTRTWDPVAA